MLKADTQHTILASWLLGRFLAPLIVTATPHLCRAAVSDTLRTGSIYVHVCMYVYIYGMHRRFLPSWIVTATPHLCCIAVWYAHRTGSDFFVLQISGAFALPAHLHVQGTHQSDTIHRGSTTCMSTLKAEIQQPVCVSSFRARFLAPFTILYVLWCCEKDEYSVGVGLGNDHSAREIQVSMWAEPTTLTEKI